MLTAEFVVTVVAERGLKSGRSTFPYLYLKMNKAFVRYSTTCSITIIYSLKGCINIKISRERPSL